MTEGLFLVARQAPLVERQNARSQIASMPAEQDEKSTVIDDQFQVAITMPEMPTDPAITRRTLESGGGKAQEGDHSSRQVATYHNVSPIFGNAPR
jgi:hypothetical protein